MPAKSHLVFPNMEQILTALNYSYSLTRKIGAKLSRFTKNNGTSPKAVTKFLTTAPYGFQVPMIKPQILWKTLLFVCGMSYKTKISSKSQ